MKYGYSRVSTIGQDLTAQIEALKAEGCETIIQEKFTGTTTSRPQFEALVAKLSEGDSLVVTKLDRLARNTKEGIEIVESLFAKGVKVHVLNVGLLENTTMGRFFLQTMLAVAEMERNLIIERTQEGKAIAKQRDDFREGRPNKFNRKQVEHALSLLETNSYTQVESMTGISKSTLVRAKQKSDAQECGNNA
ncbi:recombinase family protein [Paenibacillus sp. J2TS4]|uniref:recombinase family protein n=1 Tax=Paenibacillus sp. J2TS4 TaxID=2807194 RepID=UPI001B22F468|nr:recombinase family protein [Paenibacillus sp. J2TS4]GIP33610.1 resolvase [Paenibacillus sp. J2TS4]